MGSHGARGGGVKQVRGDHWLYDEGASISFIAPSLGPGALISRPQGAPPSFVKCAGRAKVNAMATRLLEALQEARRDEEAMSGDEVPGLVELEDGESVEWVASTYANQQLINLFVCRAEGEPQTVLATEHGDKGVCSQWAGRGGLWRPPRPRTGVCLRGGRTCEGGGWEAAATFPFAPKTSKPSLNEKHA